MKQRISLIILFIFLLSTLATVSCSSNSKERTIGTLGTTYTYGRQVKLTSLGGYTAISPDGKRIARQYSEPVDKTAERPMSLESKYAMIIDNLKGKLYDGINSFTFSPDSKRHAYMARQDKKWMVVVDGKEGKQYDYMPYGPDLVPGSYNNVPIFSPDSKHFSYAVRTGLKNFVVVEDGIESKQYDWPESSFSRASLGSIQMMFSPDSKTLVYVAYLQIPGKNPGVCHHVLVQNRVESKRYGTVSNLAFSADSQHFTYTATDTDWYNAKRFNVLDGVEGKMYDGTTSPGIPGITFSPDGKRTMFLYSGSLVVDGVEMKKGVENAFFTPDSKRVVHRINKYLEKPVNGFYGHVNYIGFDVEDGNPYQSVRKILPSPDSQRLAVIAQASTDPYERKVRVFVDGQGGKPYQEIMNLTFSPDGKHLAYQGISDYGAGISTVVADGIEGASYTGVSEIVYNSDGSNLAYIVSKGNIQKSFIILNGVEGKYYDFVSKPAFSPDGKHLVYFAKEGKLQFAVVDGSEMKGYDQIIGQEPNSDKKVPVSFDSNSSFHYLALSGENILLVTENIK